MSDRLELEGCDTLNEADAMDADEMAGLGRWLGKWGLDEDRGVRLRTAFAGAGGESLEWACDDELGPLRVLEANRRLVELLVAQRSSVIRAAREGGASWEAVGAALGISRQGAHDWYTRKIVEREPARTEPQPSGSAPAVDLEAQRRRAARRRPTSRRVAPARSSSRPSGGGAHLEIQCPSAAEVRPEGSLLGGDSDGQH